MWYFSQDSVWEMRERIFVIGDHGRFPSAGARKIGGAIFGPNFLAGHDLDVIPKFRRDFAVSIDAVEMEIF